MIDDRQSSDLYRPSALDAQVLGRLLLMQSTLPNLPDRQAIFSFIRNGLSEIPGVVAVQDSESSPSIEQTAAAPLPTVRLPLSVGNSIHGEIRLSLSDPLAFAPYETYLQHFCYMVAMILEERAQRRINELHQDILEQHIQQRTQQLRQEMLEHQQTEDALRQSELLFHTAFDSAAVGVCLVDRGGKFLRVNHAFCQILAYTQEELEQKTFNDITFEADKPIGNVFFQRALNGEETSATFEKRYLRRDGRIVWGAVSSAIVRADDRLPPYFITYLQDITERKRAELGRQALLEIMQGLAAAADVKESLRLVHQAVKKVITAENFFVILHRPGAGLSNGEPLFEEIYSVDQYDPPVTTPFVLQKSISAYVFRSGAPLLLTQERFDKLAAQGEVELIGANSLSWLGVPLKVFGETMGVMVVQDYEHDGSYSADDQEFLASIAGQVALAIKRQQMEASLRISLEKYRVLFESFPLGISITDKDGVIIESNHQAEELLGIAQEKLAGRHSLSADWRMLRPDGTPMPVEEYAASQAIAQNRLVSNVEMGYPKENGEIAWINVTAAPLPLEDYGVVLAYNDITQRKQAESALKKNEQRFRALVEHSADAISVIDVHGAVIYEGPTVAAITGYPITERIGHSGLDTIYPDDVPAVRAALGRVLSKPGGVESAHFRAVRKDGSIWWVEGAATNLLHEPSVQGIVINYHDVTQRKQAEQALQESEAQLQRQNESIARLNAELEQRVIERTAQLQAANQELEAFSYSVSHDLRSPLRAIDGYTRILLENYAPLLDADGKRICGIIRGETQRMGRLITDLLTLSRMGRSEMNFTTLDMQTIVQTVFEEMVPPQNRSHIVFELGDLHPAAGDAALIRQVWINLLQNAIKFSSKTENPVIHIESTQNESEIIYAIRDNGAGFDMRYVEKLFSVFKRLHSEHEFEGTGVGLAIVQRIIQRHGGRVWAKGAINQGAAFYFTLPQKGTVHA